MNGRWAAISGRAATISSRASATATTPGVGAGCGTAPLAGEEDPLGARLNHLAVGTQHPRFDVFACEGTRNEPSATFDKGNAASVVGQSLDAQALFLACRDLGRPATAAGLEAQASLMLGHQLGAS